MTAPVQCPPRASRPSHPPRMDQSPCRPISPRPALRQTQGIRLGLWLKVADSVVPKVSRLESWPTSQECLHDVSVSRRIALQRKPNLLQTKHFNRPQVVSVAG